MHAALPDAKQLLCIVERLCDRLAGDDTVSAAHVGEALQYRVNDDARVIDRL